MTWHVKLLALAMSALALASLPASASKRVALVIGNSSYLHSPKLDNPDNDAADVAAAIRKLGFTVIEGRNLDKPAFERQVLEFARALKGADVGLFFYAGHGLQVSGANYLVPVDARLDDSLGLDFELVRLDVVQREMEREERTNIIFLDACRNNPLARNLARAMGTRSAAVGRGLAPVESGIGTLISYSTQPGNVALDGTGRNSPFAGALVSEIVKPGEDLGSILINVRNTVMKSTSNKQVPWEHSSLRARFYFSPPVAGGSGPAPAPAPAPPRIAMLNLDMAPGKSEFVIPSLEFRTGPYSSIGIPMANGWNDYFTLLNERDGGINKVRIKVVPCETGYATDRGVECYERLKGSGPLVVMAPSAGHVFALAPKAAADKIPVLTAGVSRSLFADGSLFPWLFAVAPTSYSQASASIEFIAQKRGGKDKLKGLKIALLHHDSPFGKEPIPALHAFAAKYGFAIELLPVTHPGVEQQAHWLAIRQQQPDFVLLWGFGIMNAVALKEAAVAAFPRDRIIGSWWSGSESDVLPADEAANGLLAATFHAPGAAFEVLDDLRTHVHGKGKSMAATDEIGHVLYNRGVVAAMWTAEAIRQAMDLHRTTAIQGEQMRDGLEALAIDERRLAELGFAGLTPPVAMTCNYHDGGGRVAIQQWNAATKTWALVSKYFEPDYSVLRPILTQESAAHAKENKLTRRVCSR